MYLNKLALSVIHVITEDRENNFALRALNTDLHVLRNEVL